MKFLHRSIGLLGCLALVLAACGTDDNGQQDAGAATEPGEDEPGEDGRVTDETIVVAVGSDTENLDAHQLRGGTDNYLMSNIYDTLAMQDHTGELQPALAESWEVSDDGLEITFELREDVLFHDGEPMTAEDVVFSVERYTDPDFEAPFGWILDAVEEAEVVDEYTVRLHLEQSDGAIIPSGVVRVVPKHYIEEHGDDHFAQEPIGTGPFSLVEHAIGQGFTLERFDDFWGELPGYKTVEARLMQDDTARIAAVRTGEVDVAAAIPPRDVPDLEAEPEIDVLQGLDGDNIKIQLNSVDDPDGPMGDPLVRQALAHAINYDSIIDDIRLGMGVRMSGVNPVSEGFEDQPTPTEYDPDRARELLEEAGYPDGFETEIYAPVDGRVPDSEAVTQAVAGYWSEIGVDVDVNIIGYSEWLDWLIAEDPRHQGAAWWVWGDAATFDPQVRMFGSLSCEGTYSYTCDEELDQMLDEVASTPDPDERVQAYIDAFQLVQDEMYVIYLYSAEAAFAVSSDVDWEMWEGQPFTIMRNAYPAS